MTRVANAARQARLEAGLCLDCGKPTVPDRRRCEPCLERNRVTGKARYYSPKEQERRKTKKAEIAKQASSYARRRRRGAGRYKYVVQMVERKGKSVWALTEEQWRALIEQPCHYCELPNDVEAGVGLDRLDNSRGYEQGNVVSCCTACNVTRGDRFTPDEMKIIGAAIAR